MAIDEDHSFTSTRCMGFNSHFNSTFHQTSQDQFCKSPTLSIRKVYVIKPQVRENALTKLFTCWFLHIDCQNDLPSPLHMKGLHGELLMGCSRHCQPRVPSLTENSKVGCENLVQH